MRPAQQLLFGKQQLIDAHSLLLFLACFLSLGQPEGDAPAQQDGKDEKIEHRLLLVALHQPVEMDGSGGRCGIDEPMETNPVFAQRADRPSAWRSGPGEA